MHEKFDLWLFVVVAAAAISRALISPGTFIERVTTALSSILFAYIMTPAVVELSAGYSGIAISQNLAGAIGASIAIMAEPIIRHMYALATNPTAILGVIATAKEVWQELFRK